MAPRTIQPPIIPTIIGAKKLVICPRGHVDELPGVFVVLLPSSAGDRQPMQAKICRLCYRDWMVGMFPARLAKSREHADAKEEADEWGRTWQVEIEAAMAELGEGGGTRVDD